MAGMSAIIERHMLRPFQWGESDCCLAVCNVLVELGWPDPAARFRGHYDDEAGARALMAGTTEELAAREFARMGWPPVALHEARDGDVGVSGMSLAIRCGGLWWAKSGDGYGTCKAERAWRPQ